MYESPITITERIVNKVREQMENDIMSNILTVTTEYGINVNKDELIKALRYDRNQYNEGFKDGAKEFLNRLLCLDHDRFSKVISFDVDDLNELIDEMIGEPQWTLR